MANPVNWLLFETAVVIVIGMIELFVARAAIKQSKAFGINGQ
jgi:hypothetical protein